MQYPRYSDYTRERQRLLLGNDCSTFKNRKTFKRSIVDTATKICVHYANNMLTGNCSTIKKYTLNSINLSNLINLTKLANFNYLTTRPSFTRTFLLTLTLLPLFTLRQTTAKIPPPILSNLSYLINEEL